MSRREQVLNAAIEVLATEGPRGLTFQAADKAAAVPAGTASNSFRTRDALLLGIVTHLVELDRHDWEVVSGLLRPDTPAALVEALTAITRHALGPARSRTLARYTLFLEAVANPDLLEPLAIARTTITTWLTPWLERLGSTTPAPHCRTLLDHLDGHILHQITWPEPKFDPEPGIRALVNGLLTNP
ncbi:TetR family transcriptional regulator [Nocardia sp. NPDC005746]|uniref:TetR/AcrR family transcriptional regulator n=1 Tax=Nocardia sp. NPDC005746 TaxID=3157062 RepID=UPI0033D6098F